MELHTESSPNCLLLHTGFTISKGYCAMSFTLIIMVMFFISPI